MIAPEALGFLEDLKKNNNRDWFQAHQKEYAAYKKEYKRITEAFISELSKTDNSLKHLEFKDCSFRINRDIRFSKDKSPYKTNMGIWMSAGTKSWNLAGYYIHIEKGAAFLAGGIHQPDAEALKKVRREIAGFYEDLEDILANPEFKKVFGTLERNDSLKNAPKDYDKEHPALEFLKLKSFIASAKLSDKDLQDKNFVQKTAEKLLLLKPLVDFINRGLTTEN